MVTAGDFRNGMTIQMDGSIWQVIEFQHVKPGKGSPFVRTKLKNLINGGVVENSYNPTAKFDLAHIDKSEYQYLYADDDFYHFMNTENYEQIQLTKETVGDSLKFVKENEMVKLSHNGDIIAIEPPLFVELVITESNRALRVTLLQALLSRLSLRQVLRLWFLSSLSRVRRLRLIHVQVSIFQEHNPDRLLCGRRFSISSFV